jgi:uncharacterized protein with FMN-binding domain
MRRITLWMFSTVAALVLLFSYRTSTGGGSTATAEPLTTFVPAPATSSPATRGTAGSTTGTKTYTGASASTRWGDVQVAITVTNGKISSVQVPVYPHRNDRDEEINGFALPILTQETMSAQNADIDTVSGATVTSDGYLQSLQSALDAAHLS